jgi:hypothetical protein
MKENDMTLMEQVQEQMKQLPPDKQSEVLDFVTFLQGRVQAAQSAAAEEESKKRLKKAFETLAELGTFADIDDPVE